MAARQKLRGLPRRVKRFEADRAIRESRVARATVLSKGRGLDADSALIAVRVVILATDAADSALVAVKLPLVHIVEEDAGRTPIRPKSDAATRTGLVCILDRVAAHTLDRLNGFSIELMSLLRIGILFILGLVVAKTTANVFVTAGSQ